jgi:16S rRNA (guanine527-N7)-methyltransferase
MTKNTNDAALIDRLQRGAGALDVPLSPEVMERLRRLLALLLRWNEKINLTAVTDPAQVIERHFLDSLALVPFVAAAPTLVDVGAGAGFPGGVLAIALPSLAVTCVESVQKKVAFLEAVRRELTPNLEPLGARFEAVVDGGRRFAVAVSRATWEPPVWLERGRKLVEPGGRVLTMSTAAQGTIPSPPGLTEEPGRTYRVDGLEHRIQVFRLPA